MKLCNCGEKMSPENILDIPKIYSCKSCGATLQIDKNGCQKWYDVNGTQGTYEPKKGVKV